MSKSLMNISETEMKNASDWIMVNMCAKSIAPVSFIYNGRNSNEICINLVIG